MDCGWTFHLLWTSQYSRVIADVQWSAGNGSTEIYGSHCGCRVECGILVLVGSYSRFTVDAQRDIVIVLKFALSVHYY